MEPPDNFRDIDIYPNTAEILGLRTNFLRKNIIKGRFDSVEQYLDIHFRLLREDFISSLREGVHSHRSEEPTKGLDVYENVKVFKQRTNNRECLKMKIPPQKQDSKKFMYGSLLLFTRNNFDSVILAKVLRTDFEACEVTIDMISGNNAIIGTNWTMAESDAYFDPYFHVLQALKSLNERNFPMEKYLIEVDTSSIYIPQYLLNNSDQNYQIGDYRLPPFMLPHFNQNPGLNESQFTAFKAALSQEFVVIQGPPGTGKTFLGVKIVETLISNHKFWYKKTPILVITQKNFALDQFLEGLLNVTKSLIRVGSQSKSEKLKEFNMTYEKPDILDISNLSLGNNSFRKTSPMEHLHKLRNVMVVGMTTSFAARWRQCLELLQSPIVIVEEASEVLEAHVLASLTRHCQHLVLLGDHLQLQPITSNHDIGAKYHLGVSLFERMINNGIQCYTLNVQHRMRPEISSLLKTQIYPFLMDADSVQDRPEVLGVSKNLFFIDHRWPEENSNVTSKMNAHEADFVIALARHLVLNGYEGRNIVILASYAGQLQKIEEGVKSGILQTVRVSTLDAFQGQEADIVLLSLVRSEGIGFLGIQNRVCVGLSRARNGFFIIGNMDLLAKKSGLWYRTKKCLEQQSSIGESLPLRCETHPKTVTEVKSARDFLKVNDGGCNRQCRQRLKCGHLCTLKCHTAYKKHICEEACKQNPVKKNHQYVANEYVPNYYETHRENYSPKSYNWQGIQTVAPTSDNILTRIAIGLKDAAVNFAQSVINQIF